MKKCAVPVWGSDSGMETLAAIVNQQRRDGKLSPGVAFARAHNYVHPKTREQKDSARSQVCGLFSKTKWPGSLSIVTMPSTRWRFEKSLLRNRERPNGPIRRTFITALEREPPIFTAALRNIPGADLGLSHLPGDIPRTHYTMRTPLISRFHLASFEDFAEVNTKVFGAAWLDFTGPLTERLYETIPYFWSYVRKTLVVTTLNARWNREISDRVTKAGGVEHVLYSILPNVRLTNITRYTDVVPMIQLTFDRTEQEDA